MFLRKTFHYLTFIWNFQSVCPPKNESIAKIKQANMGLHTKPNSPGELWNRNIKWGENQ